MSCGALETGDWARKLKCTINSVEVLTSDHQAIAAVASVTLLSAKTSEILPSAIYLSKSPDRQ